MSKYIVNYDINGFEKVEISDKKLTTGSDNIIVLVLDESTSDKLMEYYESVTNILLSGNKLFIVMVGKESKIRKTLCNLAANYRNYNIYKVDSKSTITSEYIDTIIEREPTIDEVQAFVGGDISGYADINIILMGIDDIVSRGNLEELKSFVEDHVTSIESLTHVIEYMKKIVDTTNSKELMLKIEELKTKLRDQDIKLDSTEAENRKIKDENLKLTEDNAATKQELARAMSKNKGLEQQMSASTPVIQSYSPLHTSLIRCNVSNILYFKEISYVPYTNSFILTLVNTLQLYKKKVKLIIYDSRVGLSTLYRPLSVIGGSEFVANKENYISGTDMFVVVEPNPMILTSVLECNNPKYDIVIVYDRMRQINNIVSGNNVTMYYVVNSSNDYREVQKTLRITDLSSVITRADSSIGEGALNIPKIDDFDKTHLSESARMSKYKKLQPVGCDKPLFNLILEKAHIDLNRR